MRTAKILLVAAIAIFYAAAYAAAKPGTSFSNFVVCGAILLVFALPVLNFLKVGKIIKDAFGKNE
ncbi:MAG: hypothetical protein H6652_19975 [Ardenticatenaceae bacterium]|nr:hypothetical protein [Ardenticatenaceae bacterium]MCB8948410.1 hypothetical protein [Ardenticatenaceae bacterium]